MAAFEKLRLRHLFLAVRIAFDGDGTGWYLSDGVPMVPVSVVPRMNDDSCLACVTAEYRVPFPIETGPLVRCTLVRSEERCDVVLTGHHAICDGMSLTYLLRDLLRAIAHPEAPIDALAAPPPIDTATVPHPSRPNPVVRWIMEIMNRAWAKRSIRFGEAEIRHMHDAFWRAQGVVNISAVLFDEEVTGNLVSRCHETGVTVNSALWTALLMAQDDVQTDRKLYRQRAALAISTRDKPSPVAGFGVRSGIRHPLAPCGDGSRRAFCF